MRSLISILTLVLGTTTAAAAQAAGTGTLVVANMADNTATVIDLESETVLATLPTGPAPHEIAVTADGRYAVITNYGDRSGPALGAMVAASSSRRSASTPTSAIRGDAAIPSAPTRISCPSCAIARGAAPRCRVSGNSPRAASHATSAAGAWPRSTGQRVRGVAHKCAVRTKLGAGRREQGGS